MAFKWSLSGSNDDIDTKKLDLSCPNGEVLTGLAFTKFVAGGSVPRPTMGDQYEDAIIARCGVPAGYTVEPGANTEYLLQLVTQMAIQMILKIGEMIIIGKINLVILSHVLMEKLQSGYAGMPRHMI